MKLVPSLDRLTYVTISGKGSDNPIIVDLHNRAYLYWKEFWGKIYSDAGSPESLVPDDFTRQDFINLLLDGNQIVGMHLYTLHHLDLVAVREHRYFKFYPEEFFRFMESKKAEHVMSFEFLTVDPEWRKQVVGISLGEVLIGCGLKRLIELNADAAIAPARTDNKVNKMAYSVGSQCFQGNIVKRNFRVDLVTVFRDEIKPNPNSEVSKYIESLWNNRRDYLGQSTEETLPKAA